MWGCYIDVGGVRPLVSRTEINCGRPGVSSRTGKPAYKSQEEQYQEIQELRQGLGHLREENSTLRTRSRRLEEDLARRDRQIQQLMDPTKNDEARRKLTDKGASLVASLKLRVSRLEATLRAKEAELARLHASAKATSLNEMKIEAETYYQEVVRLRNQLNIVQQQQQQQQHQYFSVNQHHQEPQEHAPPPPPPQHNQAQVNTTATATQPTHSSTMRGKRDSREREREREAPQDRRGGGDGQESPSASLRHALSHLEEENTRLGQQVSALVSEKEKLTADLERVLGLTEEVKGSFEGLSRAELIREVERREAEVVRWEAQHKQLTEALGRHSEQAGENSALLQARVAELQGREEEWNRERSSLQELINTLKDDRIFYKETAQKKDSELDGLRQEVQALQQEVSGMQEAQRRRGDRLLASTPRIARPGAAPASSRSGSSSEAHTPPSRRPRPSSARPPAAGTRPPRNAKASSEPRETASPSRRTTSTTTQPRKLPPAKSSSTRTASSSVSSSQMSPRKQPTPASRGVVRQSRQPTPSSSLSSKTSTPTASPSKVPARVTSSSSSSPQHRSSLSSPQQRNGTPRLSRQQNGTIGSPQHKESINASPKHRNGVIGSPRVKPTSPVKTPTPRSSSRSSTPSSQVRSSPSKVTASPRSPSKVPQPSPRGRKGATEAPPPPPQHTPRRQGSSGLSSTEEDERVLAEIIFQRDTDTSVEAAPDTPRSVSMARQRTVTLDTQEEEESLQEHTSLSSQGISSREEEGLKEEELSPGKRRQKDREPSLSSPREQLAGLLSAHTRRCLHLAMWQDSPTTSPRHLQEALSSLLVGHLGRNIKVSAIQCGEPVLIAETLDVLRSLLSGHLSRQQEVNHLLTSAPLLVGEGQGGGGGALHSPRGGGQARKSPRQAPEGAEGSAKTLVRQGTFNVDEEGTEGEQEGPTTLHATLDAHLTRTKGVRQLK
ncbi:serine/arginine repetitive matrix protein 1-like isoform X2 [Scylla paramamosain]|uniref:serine/arginine repetitive matrix protein 1-like isoform X2 n=1 Tax=Scylla paramamosain TaxID=85552 RepID=UPI003083BC55